MFKPLESLETYGKFPHTSLQTAQTVSQFEITDVYFLFYTTQVCKFLYLNGLQHLQHLPRNWWYVDNTQPLKLEYIELNPFSVCCVSPVQLFRPEAPPSEGPQYVNKAFSAYRGIYIEKEDLQMELNKLVCLFINILPQIAFVIRHLLRIYNFWC